MNQPNQNQHSNFNQKSNSGFFSLPPAVMNFAPWIPLMLEMATGQKIPAMTGTMAEIQQGIQFISQNLQVVIKQQQALEARLTQLENSASSQFTNLVQQVQSIKSIRLSHSKETKQVDYNLENQQ